MFVVPNKRMSEKLYYMYSLIQCKKQNYHLSNFVEIANVEGGGASIVEPLL